MSRRASSLAAALAAAAVARDASAQEAEWVIPPGMEQAAMQMFDGAFASGRCTFAGASLDRAVAVARYRCAGVANPVEIEAKHPSRAADGSVRTTNFALSMRPAPGAPARLVQEVAAKVRTAESAWRWAYVAPRRPEPPRPAEPPPAPPRVIDGGTRAPAVFRRTPAMRPAQPPPPGAMRPARRRFGLGVVLFVTLVSAVWWWSRRDADRA